MYRTQAKTVLSAVAPNVLDSGVCATSDAGKAIVLDYLNQATKELTDRIDPTGTLWFWDVPVCDGCFALPEDCEQGRQYFVNGFSALSRDEWYQGKLVLGQNDCGGCCDGLQIIDLGEFVLPIPIPKIRGIRPAFLCEFDSDAGKEIVVEVVNEYGERVRETLVLLPGRRPVATENVAYDVTYVGKDETDGWIQLQLQFDQGQRLYHASYGPKTTSGSFRRKLLPRMFRGCNVVRIKGKLRHTPITTENDIIPISNTTALSFACSAIAALRGKRYEEYNTAMAFAVNRLAREMQNADSASNIAQMGFRSGFGCNGSEFANNKVWR